MLPSWRNLIPKSMPKLTLPMLQSIAAMPASSRASTAPPREWQRSNLCRAEKIGVIPYSPLVSGRLTRDWSSESTLRSETDQIAKSKYDATAETDRSVVERVAEIAEKRGVPRVHIALAWLLQKEPVTAPIIGATKISHLEDAVGALSVKLTQEEVAYLEEPYVPHRIVGHQ